MSLPAQLTMPIMVPSPRPCLGRSLFLSLSFPPSAALFLAPVLGAPPYQAGGPSLPAGVCFQQQGVRGKPIGKKAGELGTGGYNTEVEFRHVRAERQYFMGAVTGNAARKKTNTRHSSLF